MKALAEKFGGGGSHHQSYQPASTTNNNQSEYDRKHQERQQREQREREVLQQQEKKENEARELEKREIERQRQLELCDLERREQELQRDASPVMTETYVPQRSENSRNVRTQPNPKSKGQYTKNECAFFDAISRRKLQTKVPPELCLVTLKKQSWYSADKLELWINDDEALTEALKSVNIKTKKVRRKEQQRRQTSEALENSRQSLLPQTDSIKKPSTTVAVPVPFSSADELSSRTPSVPSEPIRQDYDDDFGACLCCCLAPFFAPSRTGYGSSSGQGLATTTPRRRRRY